MVGLAALGPPYGFVHHIPPDSGGVLSVVPLDWTVVGWATGKLTNSV